MKIVVWEPLGSMRHTTIDERSPVASGGEGSIFTDSTMPSIVIKLFKDPKPEREAKLKAMLAHAPEAQQKTQSGDTIVRLTWPLGIAYDSSGLFVGYAMPYLEISKTTTMRRFLNEKLRTVEQLRGDGPTDFRFRLTMAINLTIVLDYLHKVGHAVVDLKPDNILVDRTSGVISFIDCDSFRVEVNGKVFPASAGTDEYLAPECVGKLDTAGIQADRFALGVILSQILNNDLHPSSGVVNRPADASPNMIKRLQSGIVSVNPKISMTPHARSIEAFLPEDILDRFRRALLGAPDKRPSAGEWHRSLSDLLDHRLRPCPQGISSHVAFTKGCPWCAISPPTTQSQHPQRVAPKPPTPTPSPPRPLTASTQSLKPAGAKSRQGWIVLAGVALVAMLAWNNRGPSTREQTDAVESAYPDAAAAAAAAPEEPAVDAAASAVAVDATEAAAEAQKACFGISLQPVDDRIAQLEGMPETRGVYVVSIAQSSPAGAAGIRVGDIITDVAGATIKDGADAIARMGAATPGAPTTLRLRRDGKPLELVVEPQPRPSEAEILRLSAPPTITRIAAATRRLDPREFDFARFTATPFYPGGEVWEFGNSASDAVVAYLVPAEGAPIRLDGLSAPIHAHNRTTKLFLQHESDAAAYLRFFCAFVWSELGSFRIIETEAEFNRLKAAGAAQQKAAATFVPVSVEKRDSIFVATAVIQYGSGVYRARVEIQPTGMVDMVDDTLVLSDIPVNAMFENGQRRAPAMPKPGNWPVVPPYEASWTNAQFGQAAIVRQYVIAGSRG